MVVASGTVATELAVTSEVSTEMDKINSIVQKESAMFSAGVTRRRTYEVISRLLGAKRWAETTDKSGNVRWEWVEDLEKQRQGADMALRVMGDMIEHKEVRTSGEVKVVVDAGRMEGVMRRMEEINRKMGISSAVMGDRGVVVDAVVVADAPVVLEEET